MDTYDYEFEPEGRLADMGAMLRDKKEFEASQAEAYDPDDF